MREEFPNILFNNFIPTIEHNGRQQPAAGGATGAATGAVAGTTKADETEAV